MQEFRKKDFFGFIKFILIVFVVVIFNKETRETVNFNVTTNENNNKYTEVAVIENIQKEIEETESYTPISTFFGELTGYSGNCKKCSGILACKPRTNVLEDGIYFEDDDYGSVRIVASSKKYPCGTIISFEKSSISEEPIVAVVMDRGVSGDVIDLLVESNDYARKKVGRVRNIEFQVLRYGWE